MVRVDDSTLNQLSMVELENLTEKYIDTVMRDLVNVNTELYSIIIYKKIPYYA